MSRLLNVIRGGKDVPSSKDARFEGVLVETVVTLDSGGAIYSVPNSRDRVVKIVNNTAGNSRIYACAIDARKNRNEDVFTRVWLETSDPTVGVTDSDFVFPCPAGQKKTWFSPEGHDGSGNEDVYCATVTSPGCGSGAGRPTGIVTVRLLIVGI